MSNKLFETTSQKVLTLFLFMAFISVSNAQLSVPFESRLPGGNIKVKGDLVYVANNIVSVSSNPNVAYNGSSSNQSVTMDYIDVDGDSNTFSSSIAELNAPSCSAVVYAGLYWGGIYRDTNRDNIYKSVKFKIPGGSYIDIGPSSSPQFEYEQIYDKDGDRDGDGVTDPGVVDVDYLSGQNMTSYLNYANVTHLLSGLSDPNGEYTVANVVASTGEKNVSAGWTMVVIYENQNSTNKYISTFDGYAAMGSTYKEVNFPFSGFKTVPAPLPVNAVIGAGTMDGDRITGPSMRFRANPTDSWTYLSDAINPYNNVFNSTITNLGSWVDTRNPASHNTLGWDADILKLTNPNNSVLPNDHENGEILISTSSEGVILFLTTVAVEIINPEILVEKKVEDLAGNDITGAGVHLGQSLEYVLRFWNRGNDSATNFTLRDILPDNVEIESIDLDNAPGTTTSINPSNSREIQFNVPDALVTEESNTYEIRIKVKVSNDCQDFVAACSSTINNTAFSTYNGITSGQTISEDPSVSNVNSCGFTSVGATNFLLDDLTNCSFTSEVQICGDRTELTAGEGYDSYTWYIDVNNNGQLDSTDTVYSDGDPDNDPTTVSVQETGQYLVEKESSSCGTNIEVYEVTRFGNTQTNPIIKYFNTLNGDANVTNDIQGEIVTCSNDNSDLPKLFLCGTNDSQEILLNITDALTISWQQLDEATCSVTNPDCPNNQMGCTYNEVATGNSFTADSEGRYRLVLSYTGGCNSIFYFDVFQNNLDFDYDSQDIFCATEGFIRIENVGSGYGYQLVDTDSGSIVIPYSANNGPNFSIADSGIYRVDFTQLDPSTGEPLDGSCVFSTENIGIEDMNLSLNLTTAPASCINQGEVRFQVGQGRANYHYRLYTDNGSGAPGILVDDELAQTSSDFTFNGLNAGEYVIVISTDDACEITQAFTIDEIPDPQVSAVTTKHITCTDGLVTLTASKGAPNPSYLYAIWSKDGSTAYSDISDIPSSEFQRDTVAPGVFNFASGEEGSYRFVVVDGNNCWSISNEISINDLGDLTVNEPTIDSEVKCEGSSTGQVTMNVTGGQTPYIYSIDTWTTQQNDPTFVNLSPGTYIINVRSADGCESQLEFTLDDPESFKANAGVSSTGTCDENEYSEVRFTNIEGGTAPYQFSFDGGSTFITDDVLNPNARTSQLPSGNHILIAKDSRGCEISIPLTIDEVPPMPVFETDLDYDCTGNGEVAITSDQTIYNYVYTINTTPEISTTDGTFTGIAPGSYNIAAEYIENDPPNPSVLLFENFGSGPTVDSEFTLGYTFEDQEGSNKYINDFEYSVTSYIVSPYGSWLRPSDHTSNGSDPNGRYLVINVGSPQPGQAIYKKPIVDIIPNQEMRVSFSAINLLKSGSQLDPDLHVVMRIPGTEIEVGAVQTGNIPKNKDWNTYEFFINPGIHTELDFVIISTKIGNSGNDVAIDDILVEQIPQSCPRTMDIPLTIEAGESFEANVVGYTDISCNGANDGSISFEVENFNSGAGFEYSIDGGNNWITSTTSPVTTAAVLSTGTQSILVRKVDDNSCTVTIGQLISEPDPVLVSGSIEKELSCSDPTGAIKATVSGGSPTYEYALEDDLGNTLVAFPNTTGDTFTGLTDGDYVIVVRDINGCTQKSSVVVLESPETLTYSITATSCYDGGNNATITLTANTGNGGYLFQIGGSGNPWQAPSPSTGNTFTFSGLSNQTYTVNVKDSHGCDGGEEIVTIDAQLVVNITTTDISTCNDGNITVNATGGTPNLEYAFVANGGDPSGLFSTNNVFPVTTGNEGDFDVYVRDNSATTPYCEYSETVTIHPATPLTMISTPSEPQCHDGNGSILVDITSGTSPYTIQIIDIDNGGASDRTDTNVLAASRTYYNLLPGAYTINITDATGCTITGSQTIHNPEELTATITGITPSTCTGDVNDFGFRFSDYPATLGTIEFSDDGGNTWSSDNSVPGTSDELKGYNSGETVHPSMRTVDGSGNTLCQTDFPPFIIPYPLDDLDITIDAVVVNCADLHVTVQGSEGVAPYEYSYSDDPSSFDPLTATWILGGNVDNLGNPVPPNEGMHRWEGLIPGRTYVFYVRDTNGCVRQSNVNVNDLITEPIGISSTIVPSCSGINNGSITYEITENVVSPGSEMEWFFYDISSGTPIVVEHSGGNTSFTSGQTLEFNLLGAGNYYIEITKKDGASSGCVSASENALLVELDPLNGALKILQDISCNNPGLIEVQNPNGGGGIYTYTISGPGPFTTIIDTSNNPIEIPSNSPSGNYSVIMEDQYGCPVDLGSIHLDLSPNPTIDNISYDNCSTQATVTINASNIAAADIFYSIDGGNTFLDNGGIFEGIAAGNYSVGIIDSNGCSATQFITVHPSLQAKAQLTKLLDCSSSPEATIEIEALQGSGTYEYSVEEITTSTMVVNKTPMGGDFIEYHPTVAGTYEIKVYVDATSDYSACERTFTVEVPESIQPVFDAAPTHVSCNGARDGSIILTQTDTGISPLSYELFDSAGNPIPSGNYNFASASRTFEELAPGLYRVRATGTNSCTTDSPVIEIEQPTAIIVNIPTTNVIQFGCAVGNNKDNASITVDKTTALTGGTGNYVRYQFINASSTVVQDGSNNKLIVTDHSGGLYTVNVYDNSGCMGTTTVTIDAFDELQNADIVVDDAISCANSGETIGITAYGSLTNSSTVGHDFNFELLATGDTNTTGTFNGLQVGMHAFRVTNTVTGCSITITHTVEEIENFDINIIEDSPVVCAGDNSQNHFELSGGYSGGFTWTIYNTNGSLADISNDTSFGSGIGSGSTSANIDLPKGSYRIIVEQTEFPYCTEETMVTIGGADTPLGANITEIGNASCSNDQGRLSVEPTGGIAPYTISIPSLALTQSDVYSYVFTNLSDGNYTITITDAAGCTNNTLSGSIQTIDPLIGNIDPATQTLDCIGDADGSIDARLTSGGIGTVLYSLNTLDNGGILSTSTTQTSATFSGLNSGTYSINITDDAGCTYTTSEVLVNDPEPIIGSLVLSRSLTCDVDAQLTLSVVGGSPFAGNIYQWSTSETGPFTDMSGGNTHVFDVAPNSTPYQYYVQDAKGCFPVVSNDITINDITPLTAIVDLNAAFINCYGDSTASISAKASGGLGDYSYGLYYDSAMTLSATTTNSHGYFEGLPQGTYFVGVISGDCTWVSTRIVLSEPEPLMITSTISDVSCKGADDGSIVISVTGGTEDYQYAISPNLNKFDDENSFTDLAAGDYRIIVQDANGCFEILEITVQEPEALSLTLTTEDEVCFGSDDGMVILDIQGGTAPYSTSLNSNEDNDFAEGVLSYGNLPMGTHLLFVKDANGCIINDIFTIESGVNLAGTVAMVYECDGNLPTNYLQIEMEDKSVIPDLMYSIDSNDTNDLELQSDFNNLTPGAHTLTIAHSNGCMNTFDFVVEDFEPLTLELSNTNINEITAEAIGGKPNYTYHINDAFITDNNKFFINRTDTYFVTVTDENGCSVTQEIFMEFIDIEIPNFFTPDGDGFNDVWKPKNIEIFPNIVISVYDRYGRKLYRIVQDTEGWDGNYNDVSLPIGDYWYIVKLNGDTDAREFVGHFSLYR